MSTIPASTIVNVTPSVLSAGGDALDLVGLMLTSSTRIPIGSVASFVSADAVSDYFGASSDEAAKAAIYFAGYDNALAKPGTMLAAQYPTSAVGAFLRGGNISALTLTQLQALNGTLGIVIDGVLKQATVNLAGATSFSNAASIAGAALGITGPLLGTITASIAGGTMTVTGTFGGIGVTDVLSGTGVTANTYITGLLSGTGGAGTYSVSPSQNAISQSIQVFRPGAQYDSVSGAFIFNSSTLGPLSTIAYGSGAMATSLLLTQALGAVISQGAAVAVPATLMDAVTAQTQNWATFFTLFDPDPDGSETNKLALAAWTNNQNNRYGYIAWDNSTVPATQNPAPTSFGAQVTAADYSGIMPVWGTDATFAAFLAGAIASVDFEAPNGRVTMKFRSQEGLTANVTDEQTAANLAANGYNFYGVFATANEQFTFLANGVVSGDFRWIDSFIDEIWLNAQFQLALMNMLVNVGSVPYNAAGKAIIEASLTDTIQQGLSFGAFRAGVTLSTAQKEAVNSSAGFDVATTLQNRGWYLLVGDATPQVRAARGSPPCTFWYVDGQSVQQLDLSSIELE